MTPDHEPDNWFLDEHDPLIAGLAALATDGPPGLLERIAASWVRVPGPVCDLYIASTDRGVVYVRTSDAVHDDDAEFATLFHHRFTRPLLHGVHPPAELLPALDADRPTGIRFDLDQLSAFEREVLLAVLTIPRGQVRPYTWVAHQIGLPAAVGAVDAVLVHNPVPVLIPCHRVIHTDGTLGDHVFGPLVKRALLDAEGTNLGEVYELAQHDVHYLASEATGVVCFPTCPNARDTSPRHGFRSVARAGDAGYRPCPVCRPTPDEVG
jgi:methylated-DNA-[protein]-cysteine S-methyltransferase